VLWQEGHCNVCGAEAEAVLLEVDPALVLPQHVEPEDELHALLLQDRKGARKEHLADLKRRKTGDSNRALEGHAQRAGSIAEAINVCGTESVQCGNSCKIINLKSIKGY
jgi:hypothetical protein